MGVRIVALAVCYYAAGQLGILLAIPPGYATAFWPAAGIALAGLLLFGQRVWPGVMIGSFLVNLATTFDSRSTEALLQSMLLPLGIGVGATLQALLGAFLVKRCVGFPTSLARERDVVVLLVLAGPVSCLVAATTGAMLLGWSNRIQAGELAFTWWTWWMGDMIGVFLVTPLVLLWTLRPRSDWPRRPITLSVPLGILAGLVVVLFVYIDARETERMQSAFKFQTESLTRALESRLDYAVEALNGMRNSFDNHPNRADQNKFKKSARAIMARRASVQALTWSPRVKDADRIEFETAAQRANGGEYVVRELNTLGQLVPAGRRSQYFPILYREPAPLNPKTYGFDAGSESGRLDALNRARDTGEPTAPPWVEPAPGEDAEKNLLIFLPIYGEGAVLDEIADRRQAVVGYVIAILRLNRLVERAWEGLDSEGIDCWIQDETTPAEKHQAFYRGTKREGGEGTVSPPMPTPAASDLARPTTIDGVGRRWKLHFVATPAYHVTHRSLQAWAMLAGGMLFTGLLGAVLLVVTGRAALIADLVEERTRELAEANFALTQVVNERLRTEAILKTQEESLRQSEERFRLLIEGTTDYAIFMLDAEGIIVSWNVGAARIKGYRADEIIGQHFSRFFTAEDVRRGVPTQALAIAARQGRREYEGWRVRKDGSKLWAHVSITALRGADGDLKGYSKIIRDLTQRKQVEAALEESRRFIERIAEMMPSVLYVLDLKRRCIIFVNQRIESILDHTVQETKGAKLAALLERVHPDDLAKIE
jgi:PAS domain S-box-containing protein